MPCGSAVRLSGAKRCQPISDAGSATQKKLFSPPRATLHNTVERHEPLDYLARPRTSFWNWDETGEALVGGSEGATIAFGAELEHILRTLVRGGDGLPPLSLVLLVLAGCRDAWPATVGRRGPLPEPYGCDAA